MIITIDPGINNCGIAIIDINKKFEVKRTLNIKNIRKFTPDEKEIEYKYGSRAVKVLFINEVINKLLEEYDISAIIMEAPFYNALTPVAFGSLLEVIMSIKYTIVIPEGIEFLLIEPLVIKKLFSNKSQAKKEFMREMLIKRINDKDIYINKEVDLLTEHEIDAIAVGFTYNFNLKR